MSPGPFVAHMLAEYCIPILSGRASVPSPAKGAVLQQPDRERLGLRGDGSTVSYNVGGTQVFLDLAGNRSQLWFEHPDARTALPQVESALARAAPSVKRTHDVPRTRPGLRGRIYEGQIGAGILVQVDVAYPDPAGAAQNNFLVRVFSLLVPGAPDPFAPSAFGTPAAPTNGGKGGLF
jgi:hypothetical protein